MFFISDYFCDFLLSLWFFSEHLLPCVQVQFALHVCFLNMWIYTFHQFWKVSVHYLLEHCCCSIFSLFSPYITVDIFSVSTMCLMLTYYYFCHYLSFHLLQCLYLYPSVFQFTNSVLLCQIYCLIYPLNAYQIIMFFSSVIST